MSTGTGPAADIREFLKTRRDRLTPEQAGLSHWGTRRRVNGLRREEVAQLAGVSVEYYTRIERGQVSGLSSSVVAAIATALHLDDIEKDHFARLLRAVGERGRAEDAVPLPVSVPTSVLDLLDAITGAAAFVRNDRLDVIAANTPARRLYAGLFDNPSNHDNLARFVFLDPASRDFYRDWEDIASDAAGTIRALSARLSDSGELTSLLEVLSLGSSDFRSRWLDHEVRAYRSGTQRFRHPVAGAIEFEYNAMPLAEDDRLVLVAYTTPSGIPASLTA